MTWIIGTSLPFGYALGLSDIRVRFRDGSEADCLRKIYAVGRFIALGFAGSVYIGFKMAQSLARMLYLPDYSRAWIPEYVAKEWQTRAQQVFDLSPNIEKAQGCQLMLLGVHPTNNHGDSPWAKSEAYTFFAPDFQPVRIRPEKLVSIGSGAKVKEYSRILKNLSKQTNSVMPLETVIPGGMSSGISDSITDVIQQVHKKGISPHLHICLVSRGDVILRTNDRIFIGEDDSDNFIMPNVVTSWLDFEKFASTRSTEAVGACG
jgi:hypothetical protein